MQASPRSTPRWLSCRTSTTARAWRCWPSPATRCEGAWDGHGPLRLHSTWHLAGAVEPAAAWHSLVALMPMPPKHCSWLPVHAFLLGCLQSCLITPSTHPLLDCAVWRPGARQQLGDQVLCRAQGLQGSHGGSTGAAGWLAGSRCRLLASSIGGACKCPVWLDLPWLQHLLHPLPSLLIDLPPCTCVTPHPPPSAPCPLCPSLPSRM